VKRRGRNREEASKLLWGDEEDQAIAYRTNLWMIVRLEMLTDFLATSSFTHDHTRFEDHVQHLFHIRSRKFDTLLGSIVAANP
jgi:hypothetical protein